ncbi:MAG: AAA family ATPase [Deltaproteobacteria bacterium]|nr:AAA family ATPase [Deltaproteobacteria bacterium]
MNKETDNNPTKETGAPQSLLRIDGMTLENYRCFSKLEIAFDPRLTVIVAKNGCGKTAVLDAVAVGIGPFVGAFDVAKGAHFKPSDVRQIPNPDEAMKESEPQYPLRQQMTGWISGQHNEWSRALNSKGSHATCAKASALIAYAEELQRNVREAATGKISDATLPLVLYYGTARLWSEIRLTSGKKASGRTSRTEGYRDCLNPASRYKVFADWLERLCRAEYEERFNPKALTEILARLSAVRGAVDSVLEPSGWHGIAFKSAKDGIVAEHALYGQLPVD